MNCNLKRSNVNSIIATTDPCFASSLSLKGGSNAYSSVTADRRVGTINNKEMTQNLYGDLKVYVTVNVTILESMESNMFMGFMGNLRNFKTGECRT
jgi:hypothetical protein